MRSFVAAWTGELKSRTMSPAPEDEGSSKSGDAFSKNSPSSRGKGVGGVGDASFAPRRRVATRPRVTLLRVPPAPSSTSWPSPSAAAGDLLADRLRRAVRRSIVFRKTKKKRKKEMNSAFFLSLQCFFLLSHSFQIPNSSHFFFFFPSFFFFVSPGNGGVLEAFKRRP